MHLCLLFMVFTFLFACFNFLVIRRKKIGVSIPFSLFLRQYLLRLPLLLRRAAAIVSTALLQLEHWPERPRRMASVIFSPTSPSCFRDPKAYLRRNRRCQRTATVTGETESPWSASDGALTLARWGCGRSRRNRRHHRHRKNAIRRWR